MEAEAADIAADATATEAAAEEAEAFTIITIAEVAAAGAAAEDSRIGAEEVEGIQDVLELRVETDSRRRTRRLPRTRRINSSSRSSP